MTKANRSSNFFCSSASARIRIFLIARFPVPASLTGVFFKKDTATFVCLRTASDWFFLSACHLLFLFIPCFLASLTLKEAFRASDRLTWAIFACFSTSIMRICSASLFKSINSLFLKVIISENCISKLLLLPSCPIPLGIFRLFFHDDSCPIRFCWYANSSRFCLDSSHLETHRLM